MENLNDDCLHEIFDLFDLHTQIVLLQVSQRFANLLRQKWQRKYLALQLHFHEVKLSDNEFKLLIENICSTVKDIRIKFLTASKYQILKTCNFLQVHDFRFSQMPPYYMKDEDLITINAIFPNLRTFSPQGHFSGKHFILWKQLESLTLSWCHKMQISCLPTILKELNLKTLKLDIFDNKIDSLTADNFGHICELVKLRMNSNELRLILSEEFEQMKRLEELTITDMDNTENFKTLHRLLATYKSDHVLEIETRMDAFLYPDEMFFGLYKNLQRITFVNNPISFAEMSKHLECMPALREILFRSCRIIQSSCIVELLETKCLCEIKCISLEDCKLDCLKITVNVNDVVMQRSELLTLNFFGNYFCNEDNSQRRSVKLELKGQSELFKRTHLLTASISYEPLKVYLRPMSD